MKTKILLFLVFIGVILILPKHVFSQGKNPEALKAVQKLKEKMGDKIKVEWRGGRVATLEAKEGSLSAPYPGAPEDAAKQFLKENAVIFEMSPDLPDIELEDIKESLTGYHIGLKQTYKGLPVFKGGLGIYVKKDKSVNTIHNAYLPNINISTAPTLSENQVIEIAKNKFIKEDCYKRRSKRGEPLPCEGENFILKGKPQLELGIFEYREKPYLTYKILLDVESPRAYLQYIVDANNGIVFEGGDMIQYFDGTGKVFDPNPANTLNNTSLQDNNDADDRAFNKAYFSKRLKDLTLDTGYYKLVGPYVDVTDLLEEPFYFSGTSGRVISRTNKFNFTRSADQFEHVMVYYHIDTNQRYIQTLGFTNVNNRAITVDPHGLGGADDSHYVLDGSGTGYLAFGGSGGGTENVDDAEDADIILHEYGHAIQDNQAPGKYFGCTIEAGAMGEGFGDYWAASNTYTQSFANGFDQACVGEWDASPNCLRRVDSTKHYPTDIKGECHADGEIWSRALWDMFNSLGKTVTDKLVLQSHFFIKDLRSVPTFCDGAKAIIQADQQLYGGANKNSIIGIIKNRGIGNYTIKDLGTLGNTAIAHDINDLGQVVGYSGGGADADWPHAFLWDVVGGMRELGGADSIAWAINNSGQVVGSQAIECGIGIGDCAVVWDTVGGGMQDIGTLGGNYSFAYDINDSGQVVGVASTADGSVHAFLWDAVNGMQDLGTLGGSNSWANGINDFGQVVGAAKLADGTNHAFIWDAVNGMQDIGTLGGDYSAANGINNLGQVVGWYAWNNGPSYAFIWDAVGGMRGIGGLSAYDINDLSQIVGGASVDIYNHAKAVIWDAVGGMQDLGTVTGVRSGAYGINNLGQAVGYILYTNPSDYGVFRATLWQPCELQ